MPHLSRRRAAQRLGVLVAIAGVSAMSIVLIRVAAAETTLEVGTTRMVKTPNLDVGGYDTMRYTKRTTGAKVEVWVADDLSFPAGDCRNADPAMLSPTDAQLAALVTEFDTNIYPKETAAFSAPRERAGIHGKIGGLAGDGARAVLMIANLRDPNYRNPAAQRAAGIFDEDLIPDYDRNMVFVDSYDFTHRSTVNPPDNPTGDLCTSHPAQPRTVESDIAHEWQHALQNDIDPDEHHWLDEGLSEYASFLVGYDDPRRTVDEPGNLPHLRCFQGFGPVRTPFNPNPKDCGGPQDSLTEWGDGVGDMLNADYGNVLEFLVYLHDRFGPDLVAKLHRDRARHGLASVIAALTEAGVADVPGVLHDYQSMVLLDRIVGDSPDGTIGGVAKDVVTAGSLRSTVNLTNDMAYIWPGAAHNGADYVALRDGSDRFLSGSELKSVTFRGEAKQSWNLRLVGIDEKQHRAWQLSFSGRTELTVAPAQLSELREFPEVVAIVTVDDMTGVATSQEPYQLTVNGVFQPGGDDQMP